MVVPASPAGDTAVIETVDAVYDEQGKAYPYPPLRTHHASAAKMGVWNFSKHITKDQMNHQFGPAVSKTSYRHADLVRCLNNESDTNACAYLKLPRSHAFFMADGSLNVATGLYTLEGKTWVDQNVFF